ncbi:15075_t:CDS:2, partial [Cetraspora pellucida]
MIKLSSLELGESSKFGNSKLEENSNFDSSEFGVFELEDSEIKSSELEDINLKNLNFSISESSSEIMIISDYRNDFIDINNTNIQEIIEISDSED